MSDNELPGMWEESDLSGGEADGHVRPPTQPAVVLVQATECHWCLSGRTDCPRHSPRIGETSTRQLLEELRLRGDLAMVAMPTSERAADGAALSALAGALLKSSILATLEAKRGE